MNKIDPPLEEPARTGPGAEPLPPESLSGLSPAGRTTVRLSVLLSAMVAVILITAVGIVAWLQWSAATRSTEDLRQEKAALVMDAIEQELSQVLLAAEMLIERMAVIWGPRAVRSADATEIERVLRTALAAAPRLSRVAFVNADSVEHALERDGLDQHRFTQSERADDPHYRDVLQRLQDASGAIRFRRQGEQTTSTDAFEIWDPVSRNGAFAGAWSATVPVGDLTRALTNAAIALRGVPFVLGGPQEIVIDPGLSSAGGAAALETLWSLAIDAGLASDDDDPAEGLSQMTLGGADFVASYRWVEGLGGEPWLAGVWFKADDLAALQDRNTIAVLAGLGVLFGAVILCFFMGNALTRPLVRGAEASRRLAAMDLTAAGTVPRSRIREIDDLSRSFAMLEKGLAYFEAYVPKKLVHQIFRLGGGTLRSEEREIAIMFTDIAGFTTISEKHSPAEVAELLNEHFRILGEQVELFDGTIDKYIGDSLMAFWGAPVEVDNPSQRAVNAALRIARALEWENHRRQEKGLDPVHIRIGIHRGKALVGNIGAPTRMNYTIVDDAVNVCQRIESLGSDILKRKGATILISDSVVQDIGSNMAYVEVGKATLKGRKTPLTVYMVKD